MARRTLVITFLALLGVALVFFLLKQEEAPVSTHSQSSSSKKENETAPQSAAETASPHEETKVTESASSQEGEVPNSFRRKMPRDISSKSQVQPDISSARLEKHALLADTPWKLWSGAIALRKQQGAPDRILGEVNGFYLAETEVESDPHHFSPSSPLVVVNTRRSVVGVLTGVFGVKLKDGYGEDVLTQKGLKIVGSYPQISTYYVTSSEDPFDLVSLQNSLKNDPAVSTVEIEILSRQYEKH